MFFLCSTRPQRPRNMVAMLAVPVVCCGVWTGMEFASSVSQYKPPYSPNLRMYWVYPIYPVTVDDDGS